MQPPGDSTVYRDVATFTCVAVISVDGYAVPSVQLYRMYGRLLQVCF